MVTFGDLGCGREGALQYIDGHSERLKSIEFHWTTHNRHVLTFTL